jgi:hypothetical protein
MATRPTEEQEFAECLMDWVMRQPNTMGEVAAAAGYFGITSDAIKEAVPYHYWLGIETHDGVEYVVADGE